MQIYVFDFVVVLMCVKWSTDATKGIAKKSWEVPKLTEYLTRYTYLSKIVRKCYKVHVAKSKSHLFSKSTTNIAKAPLRLLHRPKMIFYSFFKKMYAQLSSQLVLFNHAIGKMGHNPKYDLFNYFMKSWYSGYRASGVKIGKPNRP